jgi:hypothetical protein
VRGFALVAAAVAAASIPHEPLGVDVPVVAILAAAAVVSAGARSPLTILFGTLSLLLTATAAWLDAGWMVALDLTAAAVLAAIAVGGVHLTALVLPFRALADAPALLPPSPLASVQVVRGALLGTLVVLPFAVLFWTGDAAFAELGGRAAPSPSALPARIAVFAVVLTVTLGLGLAAKARRSLALRVPGTMLRRLEWAIPLVLLDALFLAFVVVQLAVLFGGHDHVLETAGLTYAEYARQGFWQLIAAAALTLAVIAATVRLAAVTRKADIVLRDALLGLLLGLTLVVLASAVHRLRLYENAFGLTRARLAAETFSFAVAAFLVLVATAGRVQVVRRRLAPIAVAGAALGLLAFSLSNPDGRVAARNVERWRATGRIDVRYVQGLSADAVPSLARLPEPLRGRVLAPYVERLAGPELWASANVSRRRARALLP